MRGLTPTPITERDCAADASDESLGGWTKAFTDPSLRAAMVDPLTFGGNIIETGTDSCRLVQTRARQTSPA
ncbi:MAG: hypothetical protein ACM3ML_30065 [Micromonosporaceae bacterium]